MAGSSSSCAPPGPSTRPDPWLWFFLGAGLALRLLVALFYPLIHHSDEVFSYLEQSHRLVTGYGLVPWEYREGIRSWLLPGSLAPLKWFADGFGEDPRIFTRTAYSVMSILSLIIVWVGYRATREHHGGFAAAVVGTLLAFSPLALLYSPRVLTEVVATNFLFLSLIGPSAWAAVPLRRRYFLIGLCLGLAFVLRFQIAGAVALLGIYLCGRDFRGRWVPALSGGVLVLGACGLLDWATWDYPFQSLIRNYEMNILEGVAAGYGTTSYLQWIQDLGPGLLWFLPLVAFVSAMLFLGRRGNAGFLLMAAGVFVPLSFVAHKELRHFYPAMPPALVVLGVGLARSIEWLRRAPAPASWSLAVVAIGVTTSLWLCFFGPFEKHFRRTRPFIDAALLLHQREDLCGLAMVQMPFAGTAGYTFLNRSIPFYTVTKSEASQLADPPYNYALVRPEDRDAFGDMQSLRCWEDSDVFWHKDRVCVLATGRNCGADRPHYDSNRRLIERGL